MALITLTAGTRARAAHVNANFAICVLTDTARTISVTHTWSASQTFTGGFTTGAAVTLGGNLLFTDATYDIGASGATRPRDFFLSRNATVGGTLAVTGNVTLSGTGNSVGTITTGVWNGTAVITTYGGTGVTSYTAGDLPYYASGTALSKLAIGTSGYVLTSSGSAPQWSSSISVNTSGSAATLTTSRTIWGQNFNGSANVTGALSSVTDIGMTGSLTGASTVSATTLTGTLSTAAQPNVTSLSSSACTVGGQTISSSANFTGSATVANGFTVSAGTTAVQALTVATTATITGNVGLGGSAAGAFIVVTLAKSVSNQTVFDIQNTNATDGYGGYIKTAANDATRYALRLDGGGGAVATFFSDGHTVLAGALSGVTTLTATGLIQTTVTTEQMRLRYDATHYLSTTLDSFANCVHNLVGAGGIEYSFKINSNAILEVFDNANGGIYARERVSLAASTTSYASLVIPSGTAPTSPASGDMWYDGTNLKFRDGGTTRTITWT